MIMARLTYENGVIVSREPTPYECQRADELNDTPTEMQPVDPWCDAYCWTNCVNNVCPDGNPWCPILIDTENDGFRLTGLADPVWFDTNRDGLKERVSWTDGGEGFLALDRNENGTIDDAGELFGNQTPMAGGKLAENGYLVLAEHDLRILGGNANGEIDPGDWVYRYLLVWTDLNHNGTSEHWELQKLAEAGITRISLDYHESGRTDAHGNEFRFMSRAWKLNSNGTERPTLTWDVFFLLDP